MDALSKIDRQTNVDLVFEHLYNQIADLTLLPGDKISEADIASRFGLSRQPVRDAFSRLDNMGLLLIRPQRATEVRKFSHEAIANARFVRLSIELEVLKMAIDNASDDDIKELQQSLDEQIACCNTGDADKFHALDYDFHKLLCKSAGAEFAFELIAENKAKVDRLCVLGLMNKERMTELCEDHREILDCLSSRDLDGLRQAMRLHLGRLDKTIDNIFKAHPDYFQ